jgi:hypothetical protein
MRHDPLYTSWIVKCESEEDARGLQASLARFTPDMTFVDVVRSLPAGIEARWIDLHRLGDYFADIRSLPSSVKSPSSFRVLFHRRPDAGRFWKDLMVRILQVIRDTSPNITATIDYRGDEELPS